MQARLQSLGPIDDAMIDWIDQQWLGLCYLVKPMPDKSITGVCRFNFTFGLVSHLEWTYAPGDRWCYQNITDAVLALELWEGEGNPPGPWLKRKGRLELHNPHLYAFNGKFYVAKLPSEIDYAAIWPRDLTKKAIDRRAEELSA